MIRYISRAHPRCESATRPLRPAAFIGDDPKETTTIAPFTRVGLTALLLTTTVTAAQPPVGYDLVYVRRPRFGDTVNTVWPEVFHPARLDPGADVIPNGVWRQTNASRMASSSSYGVAWSAGDGFSQERRRR